FLPLKKDCSNVADVLRRVQDDAELSALTDRAYRDVIGSGKYTYAAFVRGVDEALARLAGPTRAGDLPPEGAGGTPRVEEALMERPRPTGWGAVRRLPYRAAKFVAKRTRLLRLIEKVRKGRRGLRLIREDPVLADTWQALRESPALRTTASRFRWFKELLRLVLLRHCCQGGPTVHTPTWVTVRFDAESGRVAFTSHPVYDFPAAISPGDAVLDRVRTAVLERRVREIVWEYPRVEPDVRPNPDSQLQPDYYYLGDDKQFRFTALERLADLEPE